MNVKLEMHSNAHVGDGSARYDDSDHKSGYRVTLPGGTVVAAWITEKKSKSGQSLNSKIWEIQRKLEEGKTEDATGDYSSPNEALADLQKEYEEGKLAVKV